MSASYRLEPHEQRRKLALVILEHGDRLTRKSGSFLGQIVADASPLSEKQIDWLASLAERAGFELEV